MGDDDVLEAVRTLLPVIAKRAPEADVDRRLSADTVAELTVAGAFRMLSPRNRGGIEADPVRFYELVRTVSGACAATGWVVSALGVNLWHVGLFAAQAQDEVWIAAEDVLVCSSHAPAGRLTPVAGGFELSGHWRFASGCDHASWALVGGIVVSGDGRPVDVVTALLPRSDYRVDDVWDVVGLRGTGSNDLHVDRVFVPEHRTLRNAERARLRCPGHEVNAGPLYRLPFGTMFTAAVTAPLVGAVEGCLATYLAEVRESHLLSFGGARFRNNEFAQAAIGRASSEIDAAVLQLNRNLGELYQLACRDTTIPMELRLRARRDQVCGTERAVRAMDALFTTDGGSALRRGNPVERTWRDVHAGSVHLANDVEHALAQYGKGAFGLPVDDTLG